MNAEIPWVPIPGVVTANTTYVSAFGALVIKIFLPFKIYLFPSKSNSAVVSVPPASDPAFSSVRPNAPIFSPLANGVKYFFFCSSVPKA